MHTGHSNSPAHGHQRTSQRLPPGLATAGGVTQLTAKGRLSQAAILASNPMLALYAHRDSKKAAPKAKAGGSSSANNANSNKESYHRTSGGERTSVYGGMGLQLPAGVGVGSPKSALQKSASPKSATPKKAPLSGGGAGARGVIKDKYGKLK